MKLIIQFGIHISTHGRATQILSEIGLGLVTGLGVAGVCCNSIRCALLFISPIIIEIKLSCLEYHHQIARVSNSIKPYISYVLVLTYVIDI